MEEEEKKQKGRVKGVQRTELQPWQKPISRDEYIKGVEEFGGFVGFGFDKVTGKYFRIDNTHPSYLEKQKQKLARKLEKKSKVLAFVVKKRKISFDRGYKKGFSAAFGSDKMKEKCKRSYERGLRDGKPKLGAVKSLARQEMIIAKAQEKIKKIQG